LADICMCPGGDCPHKEGCYRYTATPNEYRQSMFMNIPIDKETKECDYYWDNTDYKRKL
jgi:hypothetical protein